MKQLVALALFTGLVAAFAPASSSDLTGTWEVARMEDTALAPASGDGIDSLLPDNPIAFPPVRLRLADDGKATVTVVAPRPSGYEVVDVPSTYELHDGRLRLQLGDVESEWEVARTDNGLVLTSGSTTMTLRRAG